MRTTTTKLAIATGFVALVVAGCNQQPQSTAISSSASVPSTPSTTAPASSAPGAATGSTSAPGTTTPPKTGVPIKPGGGGGTPTSGGGATAVPGGGPRVPASQVDASAMANGRAGEVWTQDNGTTLATEAEQSGCEQVSGQVGEQSSTKVVFVIVTDEKKAKGKMCPMIVRNVPVAVHLNAPLGKRTVVLQSKKINT